MDSVANWIVNDLEVWIGLGFGIAAMAIYLRRLRDPRGRSRPLLLMVLSAVTWMTVGYAVLALGVFADESVFVVVWMRPGGMTLLAIIAALGIGERRTS